MNITHEDAETLAESLSNDARDPLVLSPFHTAGAVYIKNHRLQLWTEHFMEKYESERRNTIEEHPLQEDNPNLLTEDDYFKFLEERL